MSKWKAFCVYIGLSFSMNIMCDDIRQCYNNTYICSDNSCNLFCTNIQSCKDSTFICNGTLDGTSQNECNIICTDQDSCNSLNIISNNYGITNVTCGNIPNNCNGINIDCVGSAFNNECELTCSNALSCYNGNIRCDSGINRCQVNCDDSDACNGITMDCEASNCNLDCPINSNDVSYCDNSMYNCDASQSQCFVDNGLQSLSPTMKPVGNMDFRMKEYTPNVKLKAIYVTFCLIYLLALIWVIYGIIMTQRSYFYAQNAIFDSIFSVLPIILILTLYQFIVFACKARYNTFLGNDNINVYIGYFTILVPLLLVIITLHIFIWYTYIIFYPNMSTYYYIIIDKISNTSINKKRGNNLDEFTSNECKISIKNKSII